MRINFFFSEMFPFIRQGGKKYFRAGQDTDDNVAHAYRMLDT